MWKDLDPKLSDVSTGLPPLERSPVDRELTAHAGARRPTVERNKLGRRGVKQLGPSRARNSRNGLKRGTELPKSWAVPQAQAQAQGRLHYVSDASLSIRRVRKGGGFAYVGHARRVIREQTHLHRIKLLAIPPAWKDVWICARANGHLQATGRDAKGRKQYLYHERWRELRDQEKYARMMAFAKVLPRIHRRVRADLRTPGLSKNKVLATIVRLLEQSCIRIGNEEYLRANQSFGLTTLRNRHVRITGQTLHFQFRGKSGIQHSVELHDARLARLIRRCHEIPGQQLFQYVNGDGRRGKIESGDVNAYLREISGGDFTAKDFRTWRGTMLMALALRAQPEFKSRREALRNVRRAVESVAAKMGNTPAICRKSYVHPAIIEAYMKGIRWWPHPKANGSGAPETGPKARYGPRRAEADVMRLLQKHEGGSALKEAATAV